MEVSWVANNNVRWWTKWEQMASIAENWGGFRDDFHPELLKVVANITEPKNVAVIDGYMKTDSVEILFQLAVVVDGGEHYVKGTYWLEGDGKEAKGDAVADAGKGLSPLVFDRIQEVVEWGTQMRANPASAMPRARAVIAARAAARGGSATDAQSMTLWAQAQAILEPGVAYFEEMVGPGGALYDSMKFFKQARILNPVRMLSLGQLDLMVFIEALPLYARKVRHCPSLPSFSALAAARLRKRSAQLSIQLSIQCRTASGCAQTQAEKDALVAALEKELPAYKAAARDVSAEDLDLFAFWRALNGLAPTWGATFRRFALVMPSSGAAERVFSFVTFMFGDLQTAALDDYVGTAVKLRYNNRDTV